MWRLYAGGLCTGFAAGGAVGWLAALLVLPEAARGYLLVNPAFPWMVLLAFVLAGETMRMKAKRIAELKARLGPTRGAGSPTPRLAGGGDR